MSKKSDLKKKREQEESSEETSVEVQTISRSVYRKLNMAEHGGKKFETIDLGQTLTATYSGDREEAEDMLNKMCIKAIDRSVDAFDADAGEALDKEEAEDEDTEEEDEDVEDEAPKKKAKKVVEEDEDEDDDEDDDTPVDSGDEDDDEEEEAPKKKKYIDLGIKIEQDELEEIQSFINNLTLAKDIDDLKEAVTEIKGASARFNKTQKSYLSAYYLKRKGDLE